MEKYGQVNELTALGFLINAMGGGGDKGQAFPHSDAEDLSRGLHFIPGEVTLARRRGECVVFHQQCGHACCWYWKFPDGSRTYYWERWNYERIAMLNRIALETNEHGSKFGDPGPCPRCGNTHLSGGHLKESEL